MDINTSIYSKYSKDRTVTTLNENIEKCDLFIKSTDIDNKIPLALFSGKAKIATLYWHKCLNEILITWLDENSQLKQEDYEYNNVEFFGLDCQTSLTPPEYIDLLIDDKNYKVKSFRAKKVGNLAILEHVEDYMCLRTIICRTISLLYNELKISRKEYGYKLKGIRDWYDENYMSIYSKIVESSKGQLSEEQRMVKKAYIDDLLHISMDLTMLKFETIGNVLDSGSDQENHSNGNYFELNSDSEKKDAISVLKQLYDYKNLVKNNENGVEIKNNIENLKQNLSKYKEDLESNQIEIDFLKKEMEQKDKEVEMKNNDFELLKREIKSQLSQIAKKDVEIIRIKNEFLSYKQKQKQQDNFIINDINKHKASKDKEIEQIMSSFNEMKNLMETLNNYVINANDLFNVKTQTINVQIEEQKKEYALPDWENIEKIISASNKDFDIAISPVMSPTKKYSQKQLNKTLDTYDENIDCLLLNSKYRKLREKMITFVNKQNSEEYHENQQQDIDNLGKELAQSINLDSSKLTYHSKKLSRYYYFPIFGSDKILYNGFMLGHKFIGYGVVHDSLNHTKLYEGDFLEGKIHGDNTQIYSGNNSLVYEGGMIKGKRNGYGKVYHESSRLKYEGYFKKDEYHGDQCIEYFQNGNVYYEGGFDNGVREGTGIEYFKNGQVKFEGNWKNGVMHDQGNFKIYTKSGNLVYEGQLSEGKKTGKGIVYYQDHFINEGWKYDGQLVNEVKNGYGVLYFKNGNILYEGNWKNGLKDSKGLLYHWNGNKAYEGDWLSNEKNGYGIDYDEDNNKIYDGEWLSDKKNGFGTSYFNNGNKQYEGAWVNDLRVGKGILYERLSGLKYYEGHWRNDLQHGYGEIYNESAKCEFKGIFENGAALEFITKDYTDGRYVGQVNNGVKIGNGKFYYTNGEWYEGNWCNDVKCGYGKNFDRDGILIFEGYWDKGLENGKGTAYHRNSKIKYDGNYSNGKYEGYGILYHENGNKYYDGEWKNSQPHGEGSEYRRDESVKYNGFWLLGNPHGNGIEFRDNGNKRFEGIWKNGKFSGFGTKFDINNLQICCGIWKDGKLVSYEFDQYEKELAYEMERYKDKYYVGQFLTKADGDKVQEGKGIQFDIYDNKIYEGDFKDDQIEGLGTAYHENGNKNYEGEWINGQWNGYGTKYDNNGKFVQKGHWDNGILVKYDDEDERITKGKYVWTPYNSKAVIFF